MKLVRWSNRDRVSQTTTPACSNYSLEFKYIIFCLVLYTLYLVHGATALEELLPPSNESFFNITLMFNIIIYIYIYIYIYQPENWEVFLTRSVLK